MERYPFLISIPHGGLIIPDDLRSRFALTDEDLVFYSDPDTRLLFGFGRRAEMVMDTEISRMVVDLNRPPYVLPPRHADGAVKFVTSDGKPVYHAGMVPDITLIHQMMMRYYFPYHAQIDQMVEQNSIGIAFDCHSMLPIGPPGTKDAGEQRPLICLGNNGDREGRAKKGRLSTCSASWMMALAEAFRNECNLGNEVAINNPFSGGFITNAHYWHTGVPFVQVEVNRALYEESGRNSPPAGNALKMLREKIWSALTSFWDEVGEESPETTVGDEGKSRFNR
jgi:N-formylglutamate deformylase